MSKKRITVIFENEENLKNKENIIENVILSFPDKVLKIDFPSDNTDTFYCNERYRPAFEKYIVEKNDVRTTLLGDGKLKKVVWDEQAVSFNVNNVAVLD